MKDLFVILMVCLFTVSAWADTAVLYSGRSWCKISEPVEAAWAGMVCDGIDKLVCDVDDTGALAPQHEKYKRSIRRYPAVALYDDDGKCFGVQEGLGIETQVGDLDTIVKRLRSAKERFLVAQQEGKTGEGYLLLSEVLPHSQFKALNPKQWKDFTASKDPIYYRLTYDPAHQDTYKIQALAKKKDYIAGEALITSRESDPEYAKLTKMQRQGIALLRFVLYRHAPEYAEQTTAALRKAYEMDSASHWGLGAYGYLCLRGEGPVTLAYGWFDQHIHSGKQTWTLPITERQLIKAAPSYEIQVNRQTGQAKIMVTSMEIRCAGKSYATWTQKEQDLAVGKQAFTLTRLPQPPTWQKPELVVTYSATEGMNAKDKSKERGTLRIVMGVQPDVKRPVVAFVEPALTDTLGQYALAKIGRQVVQDEIAKGRSAAVSSFFTDRTQLEDFFLSGPFKGSAASCFQALMHFGAADLDHVPMPWKIALALNDGAAKNQLNGWVSTSNAYPSLDPWAGSIELLKTMEILDTEGLMHKRMAKMSVRELRYVFIPNMMPADSVAWIARQHHLPWTQYGGTCWSCAYRLDSFFGDTIFRTGYYTPWDHAYNRPEAVRHIGGVCGALSHYGSLATRAHGIPSTTAGQPGHCAFVSATPNGRWTAFYSVTPYTDIHHTFWGTRFGFLNLMEATWRAPKFKQSMLTVLEADMLTMAQGDQPIYDSAIDATYRKAETLEPLNYEAYQLHGQWLASRSKDAPAPMDSWLLWRDTLAKNLSAHPDGVWYLIERYAYPMLKQRPLPERLAWLIHIHSHLKQDATKLPEYFDYQLFLTRQIKDLLEGDREACFELYSKVVQTQQGTSHAFPQVLNWGAGRFLEDENQSADFMALLRSLSSKEEGNTSSFSTFLRKSILKASQAGELTTFQQLCSLQTSLVPQHQNRPDEVITFTQAPLLSDKGLLSISTTSSWDNPTIYGHVIDGKVNKAAFHTANETAPYAQVLLPGNAMIQAVYIRTHSGYKERAVPMVIWLSEDGKTWQEVWQSDVSQLVWEVTLPTPTKARYVRVGRRADAKKDVFHLEKIMVFGRKLY